MALAQEIMRTTLRRYLKRLHKAVSVLQAVSFKCQTAAPGLTSVSSVSNTLWAGQQEADVSEGNTRR